MRTAAIVGLRRSAGKETLIALCRRTALFMANGFDSREALRLRGALEAAGFSIPTSEERRIMLGQEDLDGADWE